MKQVNYKNQMAEEKMTAFVRFLEIGTKRASIKFNGEIDNNCSFLWPWNLILIIDLFLIL